jgi:glycosyltransferase involved in cell wall biosynthesis/uncharacterized protein (DUF433 family)
MHRDILYCEGPGDIVAAYASWKAGKDFKDETSATFSSQVFDFCAEQGFSLHAISYGPRAARMLDGACTVENKPRLQIRVPKVGYALSLSLYAIRLLWVILRVRPRCILLCPGVVGWSLAPLLGVTGAKIVPILHNALWPVGYRGTGLRQRLEDLVHRFFWRHCAWKTLAVSDALAAQVRQVAQATRTLPIIGFQPSFPAGAFENAPPSKPFDARPFRILYVGRIEEDKGALDVVDIASQLLAISPQDYQFDICGDGSAFSLLRERVRAAKLEHCIRLHGRLDRVSLIQQYREAHVALVPTRTTFTEGFAMVVAEAILCLRPVVSCSVVPATETFAGAVMMAKPDDIASYADALARLSTDAQLYQSLVEEARRLRPRILDDSRSFLAALRALRLASLDRKRPLARPDRIVIDPAVNRGKPVFRGTQIPVAAIFDSLADGMTFDEIQRHYDLSAEDIRAALRFVGELVEHESLDLTEVMT